MGTPRNLYGLGFSPLSIKNKAHAFNEEMLANKEVGLTAYMVDGKVLSAEYVARIKEHLTQFVNKCIADNTIGEIHKISFTDDLVLNLRDSGNIFDNTISYTRYGKELKFDNMRFDLDYDIFATADLVPSFSNTSRVKIEFTMDVNGVSKNFYLQELLSEISNKVYKLDWRELENAQEDQEAQFVYTLTINTFEIELNSFDPETHRFALYDILLGLV